MSKAIYIDWSVYVHRAIFAFARSDRTMSAGYIAVMMFISALYHVGVDPDDVVIVACDSLKGSWRKDYDPAYKANRKEKREARQDIDWKELFAELGEVRRNLEESTPFHFVESDRLEADDLISYGVRANPSQTSVIVSSDSDYEQLVQFPNVRLFSPITKKYKYVKNPFGILAKKIKKEQADNLVSAVASVGDYNRRNTIVNLTKLPVEIEESAKASLSKVTEQKDWNAEKFRYDSLRNRLLGIYNSDKVINYDKWLKKQLPVVNTAKPKRQSRRPVLKVVAKNA